jgi:diaminohydroxyphosphoribosylaminopyrimidine deaminase / 5-amino-6-(5-phosphoribosylamino)uracil reductase
MFDARDHKYMKEALALAEKGIGLASPNPSVGCLLVQNDGIAGRGWHEYNLKKHAEVQALSQAKERAKGATAYVTLEPCSHFGRTPPCTDQLIQAGVSRVVAARIDPNPLVSGRGVEKLRAAGIRVDVGLMSEQAGRIIEPFACHASTGRPLVISKVGMSLDGKAGTGKPEGRQITSPQSLEFTQYLRLRVDAILTGIGTIISDDPLLTYRGKEPKSRALLRIALDPDLRTPPKARLFQSIDRSPVLLFCRQDASEERRKELQKKGAEIFGVSALEGALDLNSVLEELGKRNILGLLVEGGGQTHWSFVSQGLVDVFYFLIAPLVLGGVNSIPAVGGKGYGAVLDAPKFKIQNSFKLGPDIALECYPSYSRSIISPWLS